MSCQTFQDQLTAYLDGQLSESEFEACQNHLNECPECRSRLAELESVWHDLGNLQKQEPSPALRKRFYTMLEVEKTGHSSLKERFNSLVQMWVGLKPGPRLAASFAVFLIGILVGYGFSGKNAGRNQLLQLGQEVQSMKQMMSITMLQNESSFDRMKGARLSAEVDRPGDLLIQMLFSKINSDPSVHVRLAAVDAVTLFSQREDVQVLLTNSLINQESPLVQVAIIDQLIAIREKNGLAALKLLIESNETQPDVKTYAAEKLRELS